MSRRTPRMCPSPMPRQGVSPEILSLFLHRLAPEQQFPSPVFSQILPSWIHLLNQRNLLLSAPAFQLPFAALCHIYVVILFVIHQPIALVFLCESIDLSGFVLKNARVNKAGHANV